jgi:Ni/Fe-hydrogenase subunit HybB-like protein
MELPHDALVNYIFPNNAHVVWSLMIVIYPFITGLIAGAFVVSALSHVMKIKAFDPIANFALIAAFSFGCFAGLPLLVHLGQPQRALEIYFTPHLTSPMSLFGYVYGSYMVLLSIEIWLIYRPHFVRMANQTTGLAGLIWKSLTLGVTTYHPDSAKVDHKMVTMLAGLGIPWAFLLHGYVGFVFGSVKAISWWATALQPIIFLSSAVVSGMAMLLVMYSVIKRLRREPIDCNMLRTFATILWAAFLLDMGLEVLELIHAQFQQGHEWADIQPLLMGPLFETYALGQMGVLSLTPIVLLGVVAVVHVRDRTVVLLSNVGAFLLILQVLVMRFNVVIGGQLISKSGGAVGPSRGVARGARARRRRDRRTGSRHGSRSLIHRPGPGGGGLGGGVMSAVRPGIGVIMRRRRASQLKPA